MNFKLTQILLLTWTSCLLFLAPNFGLAQDDWIKQHNNIIERDLELNVNMGLTSYFGDLSIYDGNFLDKLTHESGFAFGITGTKRLTPELGISGQLLFGNVKASKNNTSFKSSVFEYNLHIRLNLIRLFSANKASRFNLEAIFGFGNFIFSSTKTVHLEGEDEIYEHKTRVPELVFFGGGGASYMITDQFSLGADLTLHQFQNDKIDVTVNNGDFDYFTYLSFGFTYYFRTKKKTAPRNKARIAHGEERMKPLQEE